MAVVAKGEADQINAAAGPLAVHVIDASVASWIDPGGNLPGLAEAQRACLRRQRSLVNVRGRDLVLQRLQLRRSRPPFGGHTTGGRAAEHQTGQPAGTIVDIDPRVLHGISLPLGTVPAIVSAAGRADGDRHPANTGQQDLENPVDCGVWERIGPASDC